MRKASIPLGMVKLLVGLVTDAEVVVVDGFDPFTLAAADESVLGNSREDVVSAVVGLVVIVIAAPAAAVVVVVVVVVVFVVVVVISCGIGLV